MWEAMEASVGKVGVGKAEGRRRKEGGREKEGRKGKKKNKEKGEDDGSKESS